MSKVYLADIVGEFGTRCLIGDGKMLKFRLNGTCLGEFPIDYNILGLQEVDIVSVLVSDNNVEVGYNINQEFTKKSTNLALSEIARRLNNANGLIFIGKRDGKEADVSYSQYIYVFLKGSVSTSLI